MENQKKTVKVKESIVDENELADRLIEEACTTPEGQIARLVKSSSTWEEKYDVYSIEHGCWIEGNITICEIAPIDEDDESIDWPEVAYSVSQDITEGLEHNSEMTKPL